MKPLSYLGSFISTFFHRNNEESEMDEELRSHIETHADNLERSGLPRAEAERQAHIAFGALERTKEECREQRAGFLIEYLWKDVRFGLRMLHKNPGI